MVTSQTTKAATEPATSSLEIIKNRHVLNVGTTGDYPPLSWYNPKKRHYEGFDIDMADQLGKYLGVKVEFIPTTWSRMGRDLRINKIDIAMSGISISPEKQGAFLFSMPVLSDGIVAFVRCSDIAKYNSMNKIDLYGVRVIEVKGSPHEDFAHHHLKYARLITIEDPKVLYDQLLNNAADVTFTDSIEAFYQQRQRKGLCIASSKLLTYSQKGYLMDRHNKMLQQQVNTWLAAMKSSGKFQEIKSKWLPNNL
jgi:cyclohexadienyl dehydratase